MNEWDFLQERLQVWELIVSTKHFPNHDDKLIELAENEVEIINKRMNEVRT